MKHRRPNDVFLVGDFPNRDAASSAILHLKSEGFNTSGLAVFSDEPIDFPREVLDRRSQMSFAVVTGAITLCLLTIGFVYFTQHNYPIVTGGMPIFSFWATGVVFFELTMLGAIITTFVWFLYESGLLRLSRNEPAPLVRPGVISLRVGCPPDRTEAARNSLLSAGAGNVRTLERAG